MKSIVKQIFHILADIILSICWGSIVIMNSIYCANANENLLVFIISIVFSSIWLIVNIISLFVDIRELNNLCNIHDEKLKQIFLFIEKELDNNVQSKED